MIKSASILPFKRGSVHPVSAASFPANAHPIKIEMPSDLAERVVVAAGYAGKTPEALLLAFIHEGFPARVGAA